MKDIQSQPDDRHINIRKVGVRELSYPVIVLDKAHKAQKTVALVNMSVNLPHQFKGTHMSRFVEILNRFHERFTLSAYQRILEEMKERLAASAAHLEMAFPYFFNAMQAGTKYLHRYNCLLSGELAENLTLTVGVEIPLAAPAPGGTATVTVRMRRLLWIEDLIGLIEGALAAEFTQLPTVERACALIGAALEAADGLIWYRACVKTPARGLASFAIREWPGACPASDFNATACPFLPGPLSLGPITSDILVP